MTLPVGSGTALLPLSEGSEMDLKKCKKCRVSCNPPRHSFSDIKNMKFHVIQISPPPTPRQLFRYQKDEIACNPNIFTPTQLFRYEKHEISCNPNIFPNIFSDEMHEISNISPTQLFQNMEFHIQIYSPQCSLFTAFQVIKTCHFIDQPLHYGGQI